MDRALSLVAFVLRRQAGADADALLELTEAVSSFLGPDRNLSLADACGFGSTRLLDWMWSASAASKDERTSAWTLGNYLRCEPKYRRWQFQKAVQKAAAQGDLGLLTWLFAHFSGCSVPVLAVEDAAQNGHLEVLKFLLEHDAGRDCTHRRVEKPSGDKHVPYESVPQMPEGWDGPGNAVRWGSRSIEYAVAKGHKDVAKWLFLHAPHENSADDIKVIIERCLTAGFRDLANFVLPLGRSVLEYAPFCPRPEIIEMMLRSGYLRLDKRCAASAIEDSARAGRLDVMQRVAQLFSPLPPPTQMDFDWTSCWYLSIKEACTLGDIAMVKWSGRGIIPTTDLMIYPPNQFEMVMFVHASYPEMFSTWYQKKKPLVGILIGPDDRLVVDWVVEQNPHFTMLPAGTGEPVLYYILVRWLLITLVTFSSEQEKKWMSTS
ncbi:uncharacterized protein IUM83_16751 [Phytophthora cinnamomi]|uniref:uncharacterized protein n=1 Tax=Phytophthora cinnamomi TaxID=4785 RepID=UPI00355AA514|nr:hypothetical protein IUM83_16751 [Phytophthora cinnamomi]